MVVVVVLVDVGVGVVIFVEGQKVRAEKIGKGLDDATGMYHGGYTPGRAMHLASQTCSLV